MRITFIYIICLLGLYSCNNAVETKIEAASVIHEVVVDDETSKPKTLADLKPKFKYQNVEVFEIDNYTWETRVGKYNEPAPDEYILIWPDSPRTYIEGNREKDYLYSWQERDPNFIEFSILMQHGRDDCDFLIYYIFTKDGKYVDEFKVATRCDKEEPWKYYSNGRFISKNVYEERCAEYYGIQPEPGIIVGDSTAFRFEITKNGTVKSKQILEKDIKILAK